MRLREEFKLKNRNLDGCYFRVERDGKFENVCFTDMTVEERYEITDRKPKEFLASLCCHLAERLRAIGDELDLTTEE